MAKKKHKTIDRITLEPIETTATESEQDTIRQRAYEIWEQRVNAGKPGTALDDWIAAQNA